MGHVIGERLRYAREYIGLGRDTAALSLGMTEEDLSAIEDGREGIARQDLEGCGRMYLRPVTFFTDDHEKKADALDLEIPAWAMMRFSDNDLDAVLEFAEFLRDAAEAKEVANKEKRNEKTNRS